MLKKASVAFWSGAESTLDSTLESSWQGIIAPFLWWGAYGFAILAVVVFALLLVCYSAKIFYHFETFKADLKHQVKINFLSSIPISMLIIVAFWSDLSSGVDMLWQGILGLVMAFFAVVFISYKTLRAVVSGAIFRES